MEKFDSSKSDFNQIKWEQILYNEDNDINLSINKHLSKIHGL